MNPLKHFKPQNKWDLSVMIFPVLVDLLDYFIFEHINQWLLNLLKTPSVKALSVMLGIYFLFIICIAIIELLIPDIRLKEVKLGYDIKDDNGIITGRQTVKATWPEILFFYPSIGFGIIILLLIFSALGLTSDNQAFTENQQYALIWIAVIMFFIHLGVIFWKPKPRYKSTSPEYLAVYAPAVIICALVINVSVAAWQYLLGDPSLAPIAGREGKLLDWFLAWPIFLIFFSSPRFMFMSRHFNWFSMLSALTIIGYFIWRSLDYVKIV